MPARVSVAARYRPKLLVMPIEILVKRIYDPLNDDDGYRILVDRLWPRGVKKEAANIDLWAKELTPSNELRRWFHAELGRHAEFGVRYRAELLARREQIAKVIGSIAAPTITLVTATDDLKKGHAGVLQEFLQQFVA